MTKMQTKVVSTNNEESEIVTENLYSSREDGVNAMGSLVENDTCGDGSTSFPHKAG